MSKLFDLNIETVLEHWDIEHALREIIANALDEQKLTNTKEIEITYDAKSKTCIIRDYGRGLQYMHFTQNENAEKLKAKNLIGKFGVGLKDALAVFHRKNIAVKIHSKYSTISLTDASKTGFNIKTLHAKFDEPEKPKLVGTEFIIPDISREDVEKAKDFFLDFDQNIKKLESTTYGDVYKVDGTAKIYVNGIQIAVEPNFLFSYNITNIDAKLKKSLNRERTNVGRTAYTDSIKKILKSCNSYEVLTALTEDLQNITTGNNHDETSWADVTAYAIKNLNKDGNIVFMTPEERNALTNQQLEILQNSNKRLIMVPDKALDKIRDDVTTFEDVKTEYAESFEYKFVEYADLSADEKRIFDYADAVKNIIKKVYNCTPAQIAISETIRLDEDGYETHGVWDPTENKIIIKRAVLKDREKFLGVLAHECIHCLTGCCDNSRSFENELTDMIGILLGMLITTSKNTR